MGKLNAAIDSEFSKLGELNLMILGRVGAGKTTLVNTVFGAELGVTGVGGRSVTQHIDLHRPEGSLVGIFDTRGLEMGPYSEDILREIRELVTETRPGKANPVHAIWYVVNFADSRFEEMQENFVRELGDSGLPVILVMSKVPLLPGGGAIAPEALEFGKKIEDLGLPLSPSNRVVFTSAIATPWWPAHGVAELINLTAEVLPEASRRTLEALQQYDLAHKRKKAWATIGTAATAAAGIGAVPIPLADAPFIAATQITMIGTIAVQYGLSLPKKRVAALVAAALGPGAATLIGRYAATGLIKLVPGVGSVAGALFNSSTAAMLTVAMGRAWMEVCESLQSDDGTVPQDVDMDDLKRRFADAFQRVKDDDAGNQQPGLAA
ncbi:DUF697 domain-containing protein [Catellatospora coxensis]|uniref:G domain-containing protein n=1 Tax=Catellatospora coxensis TaxID=310354 RepID=A0A8J3KPA1_9ACTN|nr:DUF697 domain-containing protein [Catellatospora coxensis]GIG06597.1 hypothetical protein Cco03nite_32970 [Catellatospora coxensis]